MTPEANRNNVANPKIFTVGDILNPAGPPGTFLSFALRPSRPLRPCCRRHRQVAAIHCRGAAQRLDEGRGGLAPQDMAEAFQGFDTYRALTKVYQNVASCYVPRHWISHAMRFRSVNWVSEIELDERLEQIDARNWWRRSVSIGLKKATLFHLQWRFPRGFTDDSSSKRWDFNGSD